MVTGENDPNCDPIWGDFVDSDDECEIEDACEPVERYEEGLYYPVCIGEVLVDRYRVEHKLGHGGFSTVWMANDMLSNDNVALKIMSPGPSGEREYAAQNMIASAVQDTSRLLIYQDTFLLPGASQIYHRVLIFPLLGPSLRTYASSMSTAARRSSAKQLLQAIKALHDGQVVHRVQETITLADFGLAVKSGTSVDYKGQPPAIYCAPERIHSIDPSFASDMWSYICIFAELTLGFPLFYGSADSSVVEFMVKSLGPLPSSWKGSYEGGGQYDESWYSQNRQPDPHHTLEAKIKRALYDISPVEKQLVLSILQRGLSYSPEHRFSAGQLLEDVSFKELMAIYGL
ncbi:hypothetical protein FGADI_3550 [Fusarium gaditjirri]|uniref:Protein kinase domain-containing protein n=1 Tax=Fusarium gaditjirri TaxID=282569 RepID=A0A8H4TFJ2_9HYPO|nr:hypothetical protein FGADI_3550 [Fusarium gaditjirri]